MAVLDFTMSKYSEHLSGYKSACEDHPKLKSLDSSLQERTIKVIDSVTTGAETRTEFLSQQEVHKELAHHLVEVTQDVANFILESKDDVWQSVPLRSLVKAYFENTKKTLKIFGKVLECVDKAELGQHVLLEAVSQFDNESTERDLGGKKKRYEKTLKELKKFKAMGDPFAGDELTTQFQLIKEQQDSLLKEVSEAKQKIDEELKKVAAEIADKQKWSFWSNVIFGVAAFFVGIASIALIATGVGAPVGVALAGVLSVGMVPVWGGIKASLNNRIDDLKKKQEALNNMNGQLTSVEIGIETNKEALESVSELVNGLEKKISSITNYVDDVIENEGDEVDTKLDLHKIRDKVEKIMEKINELGESVENHSKLIRKARLHVLEKING